MARVPFSPLAVVLEFPRVIPCRKDSCSTLGTATGMLLVKGKTVEGPNPARSGAVWTVMWKLLISYGHSIILCYRLLQNSLGQSYSNQHIHVGGRVRQNKSALFLVGSVNEIRNTTLPDTRILHRTTIVCLLGTLFLQDIWSMVNKNSSLQNSRRTGNACIDLGQAKPGHRNLQAQR